MSRLICYFLRGFQPPQGEKGDTIAGKPVPALAQRSLALVCSARSVANFVRWPGGSARRNRAVPPTAGYNPPPITAGVVVAGFAPGRGSIGRMAMRIIYSPDAAHRCSEITAAELPGALQDEDGIVWLDLNGDGDEEVLAVLSETFRFHQLAIDDTLNETHLPKVDDWGRYLYLVLRSVVYRPDQQRIQLPELDIFLGSNYLVTYHDMPMETLEAVWSACAADERLMQNGPAYLLYRLADGLVNDYLTVIEELEDSIEAIEVQVLSHPRPRVQSKIMRLKHIVLQLRRVLSLQREVLNRLSRDPYALIDDEERFYFRDVYDHLIRLYDMVDGVRDLIMGTMDVYLSVVNNRMNDIMRTLTLITTLFMPLTFVTGFFGMNFFEPSVATLDVWTGRVVFTLTLLLIVLLPYVMYSWMKRRKWME
jgi:magnesium transporter